MTESKELRQEDVNSITLKKNAKGEYAWDIKIYFNEDEGMALERVENINETLKQDYQPIQNDRQ